MIRRLIFFATLLVITLGLASCSSKTSPMQVAQTAGAFSVSLNVDPDPPVPMQDALLELKLLDSKKGQPISGASVSLDLTMPGMQMPVNRPEVVESGSGVYQAKTLFTMAGKWQIQAVVTYAGKSETFIFVLNTRE
ncbi:MAG: FixH family protein [Sulfuricella sp.]